MKNIKGFISIAVIMNVLLLDIHSQVHTISNDGFSFSPAELTITTGDTIQFTVGSQHPVQEVSKNTWEVNGTTPLSGGFSFPSGNGQITFSTPGIVYYVCTNHAAIGMKGKITIEAPDTASVSSCHRKAELIDGPTYNVSGNAYLQLKKDTTLLLWLDSNFSTESGPDLDVYLSNVVPPGENSINIGRLKSISGFQQYDVPDTIGIWDFDHVVIHCTEFDHLWGSGKLSETTFNCDEEPIDTVPTTTGNLKEIKPSFLIYSYGSHLVIDNKTPLHTTMEIYDITGRLNIKKNLSLEKGRNFIEIGERNGIYLVRIKENNHYFTSKILINN